MGVPKFTNSGAMIVTGTVSTAIVENDHGGLGGLADDDHSQYLLVSGIRAMTGSLQLDDARAVGSPDLSWDGFTTTGLYMPTDNVIGVVTSGVERARFVGGNLLIGTSTDLGTGRLLQVVTGTVALTLEQSIVHTDVTNSSSHARLLVRTGGGSAGDPYVRLNVNGVTDWSLGIHNSDGDKFKLSRSATLGTNDAIVVDVTNVTSFPKNAKCITIGDLSNASVHVNMNDRASVGYDGGSAVLQSGSLKHLDLMVNHATFGSGTIGLRVFGNPAAAPAGVVAVGNISDLAGSGQLQVRQPSVSGARPVLALKQDDIDERFIGFIGNAAASAASSISTFTAGNTVQGHIQITVNGTKRWIPFYDDPTA